MVVLFSPNAFVYPFQPTIAAWQKVFFIAAGVYLFTATFYNLFGSGQRQVWDNPMEDEKIAKKKAEKKAIKYAESTQ